MKRIRNIILEKMEEKEIIESSLSNQSRKRLESLWKKFLSDALKAGFIPRPLVKLDFRNAAQGTKHDVGVQITLQTPRLEKPTNKPEAFNKKHKKPSNVLSVNIK